MNKKVKNKTVRENLIDDVFSGKHNSKTSLALSKICTDFTKNRLPDKEKQTLYIIVYPYDPEYKGTDKYLLPNGDFTSNINESDLWNYKKDAIKTLKNIKQKIKGYLEPEIREVDIEIKEK